MNYPVHTKACCTPVMSEPCWIAAFEYLVPSLPPPLPSRPLPPPPPHLIIIIIVFWNTVAIPISHQYKCEDLLPQTALRTCVQEPWLYWCIYYIPKFIQLLPLLLLPFLLLLHPLILHLLFLLHLLLTVLLLQLLLLLPLLLPFLLLPFLLRLPLLPLLVLPLLLLFLHLLLLLVIQTKCPTKATSSGIKTLTTLISRIFKIFWRPTNRPTNQPTNRPTTPSI